MANSILRAAGLALVATLAIGAAAQAGGYRPPRTVSGQPDLQGLWSNAWLTRLERPKGFAGLEATEAEAAAYERAPPPQVVDDVGGNESEMWETGGRLARIGGRARSSVIVDPADGRLPYTETGAETARTMIRRAAQNFDGPEPRTTSEQCLLSNAAGPPMLTAPYNNNIQIVQTRDRVVLVLEWNHEARTVRLDDRRHLPPVIRPWMGDSVGWWQGNTLVVETTNFPERQRPRRGGPDLFYLSPQAKVVESFTRSSPIEIRYQFSVEDPAIYGQVWRGEAPFTTTSVKTYEFACHEGNYSLPDILAGARAVQRSAAAVAAPSATLAETASGGGQPSRATATADRATPSR